MASACAAFATNEEHALRLAAYLKKGWFMFATSLLANGGTSRGLPISCFLNHVDDNLEGIAHHYKENMFMATLGGGIGSSWSDVRSRGTKTSKGSETTGIIPYMKVSDSLILASNQGITRRGAGAVYLDISHPEIMEFLELRTATGGDMNRKCMTLHQGVNVPDKFMELVESNGVWDLIDPHTKEVVESVPARDIWGALLRKRVTDKGEPYIYWPDTARRYSNYKEFFDADTDIKGSNLCTEITLATGPNYSAVCCISSVNAAKFFEWGGSPLFIYDLVEMLDNALTVFIREAPEELRQAVKSAMWERSIGLGVMGLHTLLQEYDEIYGCELDTYVSETIQYRAHQASKTLGKLRGTPFAMSGHYEDERMRNTHVTAVAPNASSSIMLGVSPGIEPYRSNLYTITQGEFVFEVRNPHLGQIMNDHPHVNPKEAWADIQAHDGSVQHVDWLTIDQKEVFRTFAEIDQKELVAAASRRQVYIDQAQSLNLCFKPDASPKHINEVHRLAWEGVKGGHPLKSLYYLRTDIEEKAESTQTQATRETQPISCSIDEGPCLACD